MGGDGGGSEVELAGGLGGLWVEDELDELELGVDNELELELTLRLSESSSLLGWSGWDPGW
jgi:hypothetical protein